MRNRWNIVANKLPALNMVPVYTQEGSIWSIVVSTEGLTIYILAHTEGIFSAMVVPGTRTIMCPSRYRLCPIIFLCSEKHYLGPIGFKPKTFRLLFVS